MRASSLLMFTLLVLPTPAVAADVSSFVVRLGRDTTAVEHIERTPGKVVVRQTGRAPRVMRRECTYAFRDGVLDHLTIVATPPGAPAPTQTVNGRLDGDSLRIEIRNGDKAQPPIVVALPRNGLASSYSSPWWAYETLAMRLASGRADSLRSRVYFLGFPEPEWITLHRIGRDSVAIVTGHGDVFHARVDRAGHLLGSMPISGTGQFSLDRAATLDVDGLTASFAAREQSGAGVGTLSPRDTVRADIGGAQLWVDYGRPGKRGRVIFGQVVPYGAVWRTGANAATQFRTDHALDFGGAQVPAGMYTLWTLPTADGWTLIVNSETGQWGTAHDPDKDLFRIPMRVATTTESVERFTIAIVPSAGGGTLALEWDTTRATADFKVAP